MVEVKMVGPRAEVDDALRELLYGSTKFTISQIADYGGLDDENGLMPGQRVVRLDYPRPR